MKVFGKYRGTIASVALIVVFVGLAIANIATPVTDPGGWHRVRTTTTTADPADTGLGYFRVDANGADTLATGLYFVNVRDTSTAGFPDTFLAVAPTINALGGLARPFTGSISGAGTSLNGTFRVQLGDTGLLSISTVFTDSRNSSGTWSSTLTGRTGTATTNFLTSDSFSSKTMRFDSGHIIAATVVPRDSFPISASLQARPETTFFQTTQIQGGRDTTIWVYIAGSDTRTDSGRFIMIGPNNKVVADSDLQHLTGFAAITGLRAAGGGVAVVAGNQSGSILDTWYRSDLRFDTGITKIFVNYWDASQQKYKFLFGKVNIAESVATLSGGTGTATAFLAQTDSTSAVNTCSVTVAAATVPVINAISISSVPGDSGFKSDNYAQADTNTPSLDTRLANSMISVQLLANDSSAIRALTSGSYSIVYQFQSGVADSPRFALIHYVDATNSWEVIGSQTFNSATGTLTVTGLTRNQLFGMGQFASSSLPAAGGGGCVIENTIGRTAFSSVMPGLRGVRDSFLSTSVGRLFVSGYYSLGMLMIAVALGFGYNQASKKN